MTERIPVGHVTLDSAPRMRERRDLWRKLSPANQAILSQAARKVQEWMCPPYIAEPCVVTP